MKYEVTVTRDGKWWMVEVPELDILTQARRLSEVEEMARSAIAVTTQGDDFDIVLHYGDIGSMKLDAEVYAIAAEKAELNALGSTVSRHQATLARRLAGEHVPVRDIGAILGVSFQRAQQLVNQ